MVGVALGVVLGSLLGLLAPGAVWLFGGLAVLFAGLGWFWRRSALWGGVLFAAALNGAFTAGREEMRYETLKALHESRTQVALTGTIVSEPEGQLLPHGGARLSFQFRVRSIAEPDGTELPVARGLLPMVLDVDYYVPQSFAREKSSRAVPLAGEGWMFTGKIRARDVPFQAVPLLSLTTRIDQPHLRAVEADVSPGRWALWTLRRRIAKRLALGIEDNPQAVAILRAVLLGYRSDVPEEVDTAFANSGTVHFFAISGLHILMIAQMLRWGLRRTGVPYRYQGVLLIPVLVAYTILTGARPSAIRACLMTSVYCAGTLFVRKPDAISSVAFAAIVLLGMDPQQVGNLGFVFSFSSVLGILLLAPSLRALLEMWMGRKKEDDGDEVEALVEQLGAAVPQAEGGRRGHLGESLRKGARCLGRRLLLAVPVSVAAWAVAEPITARVFGQMVPVSMLSNLVVIPVGEITVYFAVLGLLPGMISPVVQGALNRISAVLIEGMIWVTGFFASLPGGHIEVEKWPVALVVGWYLGVVALSLVLHVAVARARERRE